MGQSNTTFKLPFYGDTLDINVNVPNERREKEGEEVPVELYRIAPVPRKKIYMCKHMKHKGWCRYGENCKFAHHKNELWIPYTELVKRKHFSLKDLPTVANM